MATRMLEIFRLTIKNENGLFFATYSKKAVKSPLFWMILVYSIFLIRAMHEEDPMEVPYPPAQINFRTSRKYISSNYASSSRLGNHLFELASVLSISRELQRVPTFFIENCYHEKMWEDSNTLIPGLMNHFLIINGSVPSSVKRVKFHQKCCTFDDPSLLDNYEDEYLHLTGTHYQSWKYFSHMRNELIGYLKTTENTYMDLPKSGENTFITCVHVRRGDFLRVGFHVADENFIRSSLNLISRQVAKRANTATVFFGDDYEFMDSLRNRTSKINAFVSQNSPADDLLYAKSNCDVVLITAAHSTFGWWMGYFSKGNRVYYTDIQFTKDWILETGEFISEDYYLPHWTPLKYAGSDNFTVIQSFK
ncbi:L-Fucosyltransferase [Caenorhabditis elegans]|uniref:L-Fucosyltransferase n=1 Tax=Caenorhabditis elegans TaxID=6239 RepID=O17784_CAEEL|nr:L-Fucosyltransferase [Caenorhabditis elegans]CAB07352.1 L-Fucosyltransferase [Caenorhabditis elegans]|eukprot:NP_507085.1 Uncharacterized protein CELE_F11A5.5 [Caenorhabditis elegans]